MDQKEQKEKIIGLARLIVKASEIYGECLLNSDNLTPKMKEILAIETEGDLLQRDLDDHFAAEKNIPYLALDRANLVRRLDDVLDQFAIAARTLAAFSSGLPKTFEENIKPISDSCISTGKCLAEGVEIIFESFSDALTVTKRIEENRDEASEKAFELDTKLYNEADPSSGWKPYEASHRVLDRTMKIIGHMKEASELLQIMSLKYV